MDTSIAATLIGVFAAGFFGLFGFILTSLRAAVRENDESIKHNGARIGRLELAFGRLDERFDGFEKRFDGFEKRFDGFEKSTISEFGQIKDVLARIEATQAEQGRQIEKLSGGDLP